MKEFYVHDKCCYWLLIFLFTALMRLLFSLYRACETKSFVPNSNSEHPEMDIKMTRFKNLPFWNKFGIILSGYSRKEPYPDYWYNTIIGTFELSTFPVLMAINKYEYIGGWLAFKLIGQWKMWSVNRNAANRIVIATILQLFISYFILKQFVCTCE